MTARLRGRRVAGLTCIGGIDALIRLCPRCNRCRVHRLDPRGAGMTLADLLMIVGACVAAAFFIIALGVWWLSRIGKQSLTDSELRAEELREGRD